MRWMNHKKSRVMDFFRRIDKDQDGKVTRQEFIEGILSSSEFIISTLSCCTLSLCVLGLSQHCQHSPSLHQNSPLVVWR